MVIPEKVRQHLYSFLGNQTDIFFAGIDAKLERCAIKWQLSGMSYMPTDTINLLFACESAVYGPCVLKACIPGPEVETELHCLLAYDGHTYCKLWAYDLSDGLLLLERVIPGDQLWAVGDYRERARLMAETILNLYVPYTGKISFPTYQSWLVGIREKLTQIGGLEDVLFYTNEALRVYRELRQEHNRDCLLHGDLHQENLLLNSRGGYTIIDPKGVVDDPVMETARFLLNETPCEAEKIREIAAIISRILGISQGDILKSMFVDAGLSNSWTMEGYFACREAFEKSRREVLANCAFVYSLI